MTMLARFASPATLTSMGNALKAGAQRLGTAGEKFAVDTAADFAKNQLIGDSRIGTIVGTMDTAGLVGGGRPTGYTAAKAILSLATQTVKTIHSMDLPNSQMQGQSFGLPPSLASMTECIGSKKNLAQRIPSHQDVASSVIDATYKPFANLKPYTSASYDRQEIIGLLKSDPLQEARAKHSFSSTEASSRVVETDSFESAPKSFSPMFNKQVESQKAQSKTENKSDKPSSEATATPEEAKPSKPSAPGK